MKTSKYEDFDLVFSILLAPTFHSTLATYFVVAEKGNIWQIASTPIFSTPKETNLW